ncbi:TlpA family protein disulfide reductase [Paenalcaligenes niemegkensis]|uniref:TlpA family protein disulfide reductase n=1 Tax=Paenalcaligenes niemegkensis TaxID=2895469 RepID=UPI001EE9202A|nr:TlpA disulfide reductase family protein [Paenalcaligenes niemegkensis]MCQ9615463.1 TlpA family protein disulfide reductase [Paenalcaligenes niemegkensis]
MSRRSFLRQGLSTAFVLGVSGFTPISSASFLPADPFFGLSFKDLAGDEQPLSSYLGKPVVLNFWATWCAPCVEEMPDLDVLSQQFPEIGFLGLAVDTSRNVEKFLKKVPVQYPVLIAGHAGVEHMRNLGNKKGGLPFTVVFNRNGRIVHRILGQISADDLQAKLSSL